MVARVRLEGSAKCQSNKLVLLVPHQQSVPTAACRFRVGLTNDAFMRPSRAATLAVIAPVTTKVSDGYRYSDKGSGLSLHDRLVQLDLSDDENDDSSRSQREVAAVPPVYCAPPPRLAPAKFARIHLPICLRAFVKG